MSTADIIPLERALVPVSPNTAVQLTKPALHGCISGEGKNHHLLSSMFSLRHRVFKQRLKWDVCSINEQETDQFDNNDTEYIITTDIHHNVKGCVRLLPTTSPYMLSEIFPFLWQSQQPLPCSDTLCELSRFSFEKSNNATRYGFSNPVIRLLRNLVLHAQQKNITRYIFVTTVSIERMLMIQGISIERIGDVVQLGNAATTVIFMNINDKTEQALFR